jgi:hypothetical protein
MGDGLIVEDASIISWTGVNIVQYDDILCEDPGSLLHFTADSICTVDEELEPSEDGVLRFDIDFFATAPSLQVGDRFIVQGGLAVTNESGSFASSNIGDYIPLIQVADIVGSVFDSIVFPAMPEGLGLQLAQQDGFRGTGTEIGVEVIGIDGAQFANPFLGDLDNPFVDIVAFDADGDGIDEIAILFDGTPGSISTYSVTQDASPTLIDGLVESVGNGPVDIDAGDIDGDGLCDLLVTNATDSTITVLMTEVAADASLYFSILTIDMSGSGSQSLSCGAVIDWDGIDPLDAVVGIDRADPFQKDVLQVMLDIGSTLTTGPTFEIPMFVIDDELFADTPMAVDGGEFLDASARWGFASGTRYGRVHHADQNTNGLQTLAELGISRVVSIESLDLDDGGGDGIQDLMVVSDEAETIYLFQGDVAEPDGFGNLIALTVSERVEDVVAIDADADGDMDLVFTVPSSENPLGLLRNDGTVQPLVATLGGRTWSRQEFDSITPVTRLASGGLEGKDDEDDWVIGGGNQSSNLLGDPQGVMEQTNILIGSICESDFNHDTIVDVNDLLILIAAWGNCDSCQEDINDDAIVDVNDLLIVIAAWGPCK